MTGERTYDWPDGWPTPRVGEFVVYADQAREVTSVTYYPVGDADLDDPVIYVMAR